MTTKQPASGKPAKAGPSATISLLQKLAANKKKREAARQAEAQQRAAFLESEQRTAELDDISASFVERRRNAKANEALTRMEALKDDLDLNGCASDYLDTEKILYPAEPEEPTTIVDASIAAATEEALTSMGLNNAALSTYFENSEDNMNNGVFRNAVISGFIATQAIKKQHCSDETAAALFSLMAYSHDGELAGAAFKTLLCMLEEDSICVGTEMAPHYGFDIGNNSSSSLNLSTKAIPSAKIILNALKKNGYMTTKGSAAAAGKKNKKNYEKEEGDEEKEGEEGIRVYAIKLLLHTTIAVCNHCDRKPEVSNNVLPRSDVSDLLLAVMTMGLDSAAVRLQPDLDAACIALIGVLTNDDWSTELPVLAKKLAGIGKSSGSRLRVLRQLPVNESSVRSRARQLQRFAGCILVEKILPKNLGPKSSAIPSRGLIGAPDPTDILLAQPWFRNAKAVLSGAIPPKDPSSSTAAAAEGDAKKKPPPPEYSIGQVELLLHVCDVLLWPSALRMVKERSVASGAASPSPVKQKPMGMIQPESEDLEMLNAENNGEREPRLSPEFLAAWSSFLTGIIRNIKTLQPEEMAVKTLASRLEFKYKESVEKPVWALSP